MSSKNKVQGFQGGFRQSMAWLHTWAGLVLSIVLYFVFITGTFGYFNSEISHWMKPELPTQTETLSYAEQANAGFSYLQEVAPDATRYFVNFSSDRSSGTIRAFANLKNPDASGARSVNTILDPHAGEAVQARESGGGNALYRMHYALHYIPYEAAIYIVGVATLFMFLAIITGIVTHKKIFADFFTLRLGKGQRSWLDGHNLSSVLALPFMIMITYSGLVFYTFNYSPGVAVLTLGTDRSTLESINEHLYPRISNVGASGQVAEMHSIEGPINTAREIWPDAELRYVDLHHPGDVSAYVAIARYPQGIARRGDILYFNAVTGELTGRSPPQPADGFFSSATMSLHEGNFADYALRWLYFLSGLLGAAMIATGSLLWAKKRRNLLKGAPAPRSIRFVERANLATIVGLPLGCAAYFWANRVLPIQMDDRAAWEMNCLFLMWAASFMHAGARELRRAWREQVLLLAVLFMALPLLNVLTTDVHLGVTLAHGDWVRAGFDITAFVFGALVLLVYPSLSAPATTARSDHQITALSSMPSTETGG
ncbi:MAG: PepSY-associated TM helix domain-containing protein [Pseudomonadota bacterium]